MKFLCPSHKSCFFFLSFFVITLLWCQITEVFAAVSIPGGDTIKEVSIKPPRIVNNSVGIDGIRDFGLHILSIARVIISGFALIYIMLIGAYMIAYSDSEETISKQKQQLINVLVAFLFLNVPAFVYNLFIARKNSSEGVWKAGINSIFWDDIAVNSFISSVMNFLKIGIFIAAVFMFSWGAFQMILSRGKEEYREGAVNRIIYGSLALIFLWLVEGWSRIILQKDIQTSISNTLGPLFGMALFFAAPVAVFFVMIGAYYYITSAGNEDRAKKGKNIIIYTVIAGIILLASFSFLHEFQGFFSQIDTTS